ncbi:MAG: phosphoribosylamine--glycine ligase [Synergistaceae bacterium]|jgi:phosphoribosylamine--glycine ligase|nr:phosphoribosylamine--glycine ligase [Synergistaceae bacterium]
MRGKTDVLVLGSGGREHAIVHALSKSNVIGKIHCAPGNPGIAELARIHDADPCDKEAIRALCEKNGIDFVMVGPEAPLAAGLSDALRSAGIKVFGPGAGGAVLEGSKAFSKSFMARHGIPTAPFDICHTEEDCAAAIAKREPPFVIKADGLAAGKGVFLPDGVGEALEICRGLLSGETLGESGRTLIIEDFLPGKELTVLAVTDGESFKFLPPSRDHKRIFDGDRGPNTGGMGAYSPVRLPDRVSARVADEVMRPTLRGLASEGIEYRGVIYLGLMLTEAGGDIKISVVEYNVRFGDPETQAVLPLLTGDFGQLALSAAEGTLRGCPDVEYSGNAFCVVAASGGYPGKFRKGVAISGLDDENAPAGTFVYHSGTAKDGGGNIVTNGGRVLSAVGTGRDFAAARDNAYARVAGITFEDMHYRKDIGWSEE